MAYLECGKYAKQVKEFLKYFDVENMLFLISEDFRENREKRMREVFDFLNIEYIEVEMPDIHVGGMPKSEFLRRINGIVKMASRVIWDFPELRNLTWDVSSLIKKFNRIEGKKPPMNEETKRKLYEYYEPYNQELMDLFDEIGLSHLSKMIEKKWKWEIK